jgi:hypothetical protein
MLLMSNRPVTKHLRPSQVTTARERGEVRSFCGLMLEYTLWLRLAAYVVVYVQLEALEPLCAGVLGFVRVNPATM